METHQAMKLLQASVDEEDVSYVRLLCDGKHVRYVSIAAGLYAAEDMCFAPTLISLLPPFPPGDWNVGHIEPNPEDGAPHFAQTIKKQLPGLTNIWHPTHLDHLSLTYGKKLRSGVYEATTPAFPDTVVVAKFARFDWEIDALDQECQAYSWLENQNIAPRFLGHLVEAGRGIGFVMEKVSPARHAAPSDGELCRAKVSELHRLGVIHGDVNRFNVLIREGGGGGKERVVLIDFECARRCDDVEEFERELEGLVEQLGNVSGRGGRVAVVDSTVVAE